MGRSKAWLPFPDRPLLEVVVEAVSAQLRPVIVVAAKGQDLPCLPPQIELLRDPIPDQGPIRGLATALDALRGRADWAFVIGTDAPVIHPDWIAGLTAHAEGVDLVLPHVDERDHPLSALYRIEAAAPVLHQRLVTGTLRLRDLAHGLTTRRIEEATLRQIDPLLDTLRNLNTPEDYRRALEELERPDDRDGR